MNSEKTFKLTTDQSHNTLFDVPGPPDGPADAAKIQAPDKPLKDSGCCIFSLQKDYLQQAAQQRQ